MPDSKAAVATADPTNASVQQFALQTSTAFIHIQNPLQLEPRLNLTETPRPFCPTLFIIQCSLK